MPIFAALGAIFRPRCASCQAGRKSNAYSRAIKIRAKDGALPKTPYTPRGNPSRPTICSAAGIRPTRRWQFLRDTLGNQGAHYFSSTPAIAAGSNNGGAIPSRGTAVHVAESPRPACARRGHTVRQPCECAICGGDTGPRCARTPAPTFKQARCDHHILRRRRPQTSNELYIRQTIHNSHYGKQRN